MGTVSQDNRVGAFSQQGSLDWVALGRTQYTASIAILSRLAGSGIEPITVAFGQAICCRLPTGAHGEKFVHDALQRLKAFSSFGDILWFGVGVRHILRDLVQTSQGSALVALCGALSEGHSARVSALILFELGKLLGAPEDLRPSFSQWKALVEVTGSIFNETTFGLRVGQLQRLNGLSLVDQKILVHPSDLAHAIVEIGQVASGTLKAIHLQGGSVCSWIAAWTDLVLGLRVEVRSKDGHLIFVNFDTPTQETQVAIDFQSEQMDDKSVHRMGRTFTLRSGTEFIRDCFLGDSNETFPETFTGGRVSREHMFEEVFSGDFLCLIIMPKTFQRQFHGVLQDFWCVEPKRSSIVPFWSTASPTYTIVYKAFLITSQKPRYLEAQ